jgi:hypothetical protein
MPELSLDLAADKTSWCVHGRIVAWVTVDGREVGLTDHTIAQWIARVKPSSTQQTAVAELARMLESHGELLGDGPCWASPKISRTARGWLRLGDGIALPLDGAGGRVVAYTVLVPAGLTPAARQRRTERKRQRRQKHRTRGDRRRTQ